MVVYSFQVVCFSVRPSVTLIFLLQLSEQKEKSRLEVENSNKLRKQLTEVQQRLTISDQSYSDINMKYSELQSAKQTVEKELRDLRVALESEALNRNQVSEHTAELHGRKLSPYMSRLTRLWHFSSSVNSFFKRACAAVQWG